MRFRRTFLVLILLLCAISLEAQLREMRAVWIATVKNIDWPSKPGLTVKEQQEEFRKLLDFHRSIGINTVIFQVRPAADAFYDSPYEGWSIWLNNDGVAPEPKYDPLEFAIQECRKRGMELHAWFNPFRASLELDSVLLNEGKGVIDKDWLVAYGSRVYLDPGIPEVRAYTQKVVLDVVRRYDIDAVHFDDYFYPYKIAGVDFPDENSYIQSGSVLAKADWRRSNVDQFVTGLAKEIKLIKSQVRFGISPFGVWRNQSEDLEGSMTAAGQTSYDDLFADVRKWASDGLIDYVMPQIYFSDKHPTVNFKVLTDWWVKNKGEAELYLGLAAYKVDTNSDLTWSEPNQLNFQIAYLRQQGIKGMSFFSSASLIRNKLDIVNGLSNEMFRYQALPLQVTSFMPNPRLGQVRKIKVKQYQDEIQIDWRDDFSTFEYAVFLYESDDQLILAEDLIAVTNQRKVKIKSLPPGKYGVVVAQLDRNWRMGNLSKVKLKKIKR